MSKKQSARLESAIIAFLLLLTVGGALTALQNAGDQTLNQGSVSTNHDSRALQMHYSPTKIELRDPPTYLPTANFSVEGNLTTISGVPLPNAPVKITFINSTSFTTTNEDGVFTAKLNVPADARNGIYDVYASFAPEGVYGPSFNFTTIQIAHLLLNVNVQSPTLSWAGFSTQVRGTVITNNSGVGGAKIQIISPWKTYTTTSGSGGTFETKISVPFWELALSGNLSIEVTPSQPYIQNATVSHRLGLFNILYVAIPGIVVGVSIYEVESLGLLSSLRSKKGSTKTVAERISPSSDQTADMQPSSILDQTQEPEMISIYHEALSLATRKFNISFRRSSTIREAVSSVSKLDSSQGSKLFSAILITLEDYFYAKKFDKSRVESLRAMILELKEIWK